MIKRNLLLTLFVIWVNFSFATIEKSGTVSSNETWSEDTIKVIGDINIQNGVTLTINPGVFIEFQGYYKIDVQGRILAQGTTSDSIEFNILPDSIDVGWNGIVYENTPETNDTSKFEYCKFRNSKRNQNGGLFYIYNYSKIFFSNCLFADNKAQNSGSYEGGGAIFLFNLSNITIQKCQFINNEIITEDWGSRGGAIYSKYSSLKVKNCVFKNNGLGTTWGGAMAFTGGSGRLENCLFISNSTSSYGGALYGDYGFNGKIINNNFIDNQSSRNDGGAIYLFGQYGWCNISVINTIIWQNSSRQILINNSKAVIEYSCIENSSSSVSKSNGAILDYKNNNLDVDPKFIDKSNDNFEIESSSLLINAGIPDTTGLDMLKYDLKNNLRIANDRIDIGAYEFQSEPDPRIVLNNDISDDYIRYDSLFTEGIYVLSYPEAFVYTFLSKPDGMILENDSIKWTPIKDQVSQFHNVSLKVANANTSDTLNFKIYVLDDNEFYELEDGDITWDFDTVKVLNDLTVKNGNTLYIKPGTYVEFQDHFKLNMQGRILAEGKVDSIITFCSKDTLLTSSSGGWHGIRFDHTPVTNDTSKLVYCNLRFGNAYIDDGGSYSDYGGAIYIHSFDKVKVTHSIFDNNKADKGGGIYASYASPQIINCLFYENSANYGGAMSFSYGGIPLIVNNTIINNNSGIRFFSSSANIVNTILWNRSNYEVYGYSVGAKLRYCNTSGKVFTGEGNISLNPLVEDANSGKYYLTDKSPCINIGVPDWTADSLCSSTDILGNNRVKYERVDIGAFEFQEILSPRGIEITNDTISEHCDSSLFVGKLTTQHPYPTESYKYSFDKDSVNSDTLSFYISNDSLYTAQRNFNFEIKDKYELFIKTVDNNDKFYTELVEIKLKDENDTPTDITLSNNIIDENSSTGIEIGSLSTVDEDQLDTFRYKFVSGDGNNDTDTSYFDIEENRLIVKDEPNYEVKRSLNIVIRSIDKGGLYIDRAFTINVNDINEYGLNPFQHVNRTGAVNFVIDSSLYVGLGNNADSVMCNFWKYDLETDLWTEIARFPGEPRSEAVAFVIEEKAYVGLGRSEYPYTYYKDFYEYNPQTNEWTQIADFEGSARYNSVAFAVESMGYAGTGSDASGEQKDFWKYDPQLNTWTQVSDMSADKRGGAVAFVIDGKAYVSGGQYFDSYSVQLSDVQEYNPETDTWEEKIFADGTNLSFSDASSLVIGEKAYICYGNKTKIVRYDPVSNDVTDYGDFLDLGNKRFDPVAFVLDSTVYFGLGYYGIFDPVYQNDILELDHLPTNIILSGSNLNENSSASTLIGTLSTFDKDISETHDYTLVSGNGINDADNGSFSIIGNELYNEIVPDFETKNTYNIYAQTEDDFGAILKKAFVININDINEGPTDVNLSENTIDENSSIGTVIGIFSTDDEDEDNTHAYSLVVGNGTNDADNSSFEISGNELQSLEPFNFETKDQYHIYINTEDQDGEAFSKAFVININDLNESPTEISLSNSTINENSDINTVIGTLSSVDEDTGDTHTYSLVSGDGTNDTDNGSFEISGNELQNSESFNYETKDHYYINIQTEDQDGEAFSKAFIINVNDLNDNPTEITLSNTFIDENSSISTVVGILNTTDEDAGDTHTYSLVSGDGTNDSGNSSFKISENELQNAEVFDFETQSEYYIFIETDDGSEGSYQKAFVVTVNDVTEVGIQDLSADKILIYPNPTPGLVNVDLSEQNFDEVQIKVISASGRVVYINNTKQVRFSFDLSANRSGIYFILIETDNYRGIQKVILE